MSDESGWLKSLNDRQREAVTAPLGPVLVLAGAGSGKTRVLTYRIAYLLRENLFRAGNLLALTFTNKAAGEMRARIIGLIGKSEKRRLAIRTPKADFRFPLVMGTFHSVCARILRAEISRLGLGYGPNFVIFDAEDSSRLLKQIVMELGLEERFRPQVFAYYISAAKNRLVDTAALALENPYLQETLREVSRLYQERLREQNALDFDDLLGLVCRLFQTDTQVLKKYQEQFRYVLVDEYQDTNHAQYVLLKLLVQKHRNLFVVGDDAQSIYGFRGANLQNILDFRKDYPRARIIMLEQNYRSTQNILDAAGEVLSLNPLQYEKKLWTQNQAGPQLQLYEAQDEMDESEFVLRRIVNPAAAPPAPVAPRPRELTYMDEEEEIPTATPILDRFLRQRPPWRPARLWPGQVTRLPDLKETVILYRTHAQSRPFEEVLLGSGIPYQIVGGIKFYERKEIKDVLAYLRLLTNPRDLVSLARVINIPARGLGPANFRAIAAALPKYNYNYTRFHRDLKRVGLPARAATGAEEFFGLLAAAAKLPKEKSILDLMHLLLNRTGFRDSILDNRSPEGEARWENVEQLFDVAARYKKLPWPAAVQAFLEEAALMTDLDSLSSEGNALTLMTLHSAKGLEFDNVFLVGLEEGLLPHSRSLMSVQETAEEIRLAYVGMTRARQNLYLSYARQRQTFGELKKSIPSRILKAIPKKLIQKIS